MTMPSSSHRIRTCWVVGVLAIIGMLLSGCGRDGIQRASCTSANDCASDQLCVGGVCTDEDDTDAGPNNQCVAMQGGCYREICSGPGVGGPDVQSSCSLEVCEVQCEPFETQDGCECAAASCESRLECGDYACIDGSCQPCSSDTDCASGEACRDDGTCGPATACEEDTDCPADQECDDGECVDQPDCLVDDDCDDGESCFNGRCTRTPSCEKDEDCPDGQSCIGGECFAEVCSSDNECAGDRICDAGECVKPSDVEECFVATNGGQISNNQRIQLEAYALDESGEGVSTRFIWQSSNTSAVSIDPSGPAAVGGTSSGEATVTASVAGQNVECSGDVVFTNPGVLQSGETRFVVTDAKTGQPVSGATVSIEGGVSRQSNSAGVVNIPSPSSPYTVSVFAGDYNYLTVRGLRARDVRLPLVGRSGDGPVAGFTGEFDTGSLNTSGNFTVGLAGASIPGGLLGVGVTELLGQPFSTEIQQFSTEVALPAGIVAYGEIFGSLQADIKRDYYATTPGGARLGWGLAGKVPPSELINIVQGSTGFTEALGTLLPLFNRFDHAIRPLQLTERPRVADTNDIDGDDDTSEMVPDYDAFPRVSLKPNVQQNLLTEVSVSNFPEIDGSPTEIVMFVGGNVSRSAGFVPLGITATTDENSDGAPDTRQMSLAPQHSSLSGGRYAVTALTFQPDGAGGPGGGVALPDEYSAALWSRQSLPNNIGLGTFPEPATGTVDRGNREISVTSDAGPLYRLRIIGDTRSWEIFSAGGAQSGGQFQHAIEVPPTASGVNDLLRQSGTRVSLDSIQSSVGVDDIARATGVGLRRIGLVATAYNRSDVN